MQPLYAMRAVEHNKDILGIMPMKIYSGTKRETAKKEVSVYYTEIFYSHN